MAPADHPAGKWRCPLITLRSLQVRVHAALHCTAAAGAGASASAAAVAVAAAIFSDISWRDGQLAYSRLETGSRGTYHTVRAHHRQPALLPSGCTGYGPGSPTGVPSAKQHLHSLSTANETKTLHALSAQTTARHTPCTDPAHTLRCLVTPSPCVALNSDTHLLYVFAACVLPQVAISAISFAIGALVLVGAAAVAQGLVSRGTKAGWG